jgi:hypothetical protein
MHLCLGIKSDDMRQVVLYESCDAFSRSIQLVPVSYVINVVREHKSCITHICNRYVYFNINSRSQFIIIYYDSVLA